MKQKRTFVTLVLIIALLCLGIAFAAISNITLTINGQATAAPSDDNFKVKFTGTVQSATVVGNGTATGSITNDTNATITCTGMSAKGDKVTATYTVLNDSPDLSASIDAVVTSTNSKFSVTEDWTDDTVLAKGDSKTITVTVELLETVMEDVTENVTVQLTAEAVQP